LQEKIRQQEAFDIFQWLAMSPDMKPIDHACDSVGSKVNQNNQQCQHIAEGKKRNFGRMTLSPISWKEKTNTGVWA
jgi:hypothetical protein